MRSIRIGLSALIVSWSMLPLACDKGGDQSAIEEHCKSICEKREMCDSKTDLMGCEDNCMAQTYRSDAYFSAKAKCVEKLSCDQWVGELSDQGEDTCEGNCKLADCVDDALSAEAPSEEQESYCQSVSNKLAACDASLDANVVAGGCKDALIELSEDYATDSKACVEMSCGEIVRCLDKLADRSNTDLKIFDGELTAR